MHSFLPRGRAAAVVALLTAVTVGAGLVTAIAWGEDEPGTTTTTTTTNRASSSTTFLPGGPTTTAPPSTTTTAPPPGDGSEEPGDDGPGVGEGDGGLPAGQPRVVPAEYQKLINSVKRSRANNTAKLQAALRPLVDLGMSEQDASIIGFGRFPVAGYATFIDDWWLPRFVPTFHLHEGTDIFAPMGTPVRSPAEGVVRRVDGPVGGLAVYVRQKDGTEFYMAHLSAFAEPADGQTVKVGEIVGYVGDSGNARGGAPHVHFEIHPKGKGPVPPKPSLDLWIEEAIARAPTLIATFEAGRPRAVVATGLTRQLADPNPGYAGPAAPPRPQLLWATSASPSGGALRVAEAEAIEASRMVDWKRHAARYERQVMAWAAAERRAKALLAPLTPPALHDLLGY